MDASLSVDLALSVVRRRRTHRKSAVRRRLLYFPAALFLFTRMERHHAELLRDFPFRQALPNRGNGPPQNVAAIVFDHVRTLLGAVELDQLIMAVIVVANHHKGHVVVSDLTLVARNGGRLSL